MNFLSMCTTGTILPRRFTAVQKGLGNSMGDQLSGERAKAGQSSAQTLSLPLVRGFLDEQ